MNQNIWRLKPSRFDYFAVVDMILILLTCEFGLVRPVLLAAEMYRFLILACSAVDSY